MLHTYDVKERVLTFGNGAKRRVDASPVKLNGEPALAVPSSEATEIYVFDAQGRHLQTLDGITSFALLKFQWSDAGLLSVSETGDHTTRILRDDKGVPTSIISARGYRTRLGIKDGWLASVVTPSDHISRMTTSPQGLVTEFQNAINARTAMRYDQNGKLTAIEGPTGSSLTLKSEDSSNGSSLTVTTGGGRSWTHSIKKDGAQVIRTYTDPAGTVSIVEIEGNKRVLKTPDGTIYRLTLQADPQWGTAAGIPAVEAETPVGRRWTIGETRKGAPLNAQLQPQAHQRTLTVDGAAWTLSYEPSSKKIAFHTPEGESRTTTLNDKGQPLRIDQSRSAPLVYAYDSQSRLKSITHGEGPDARQWRYEFNAADRTVITTDPLGKKRVLSFDQSGHATALTTPEGNKIVAERNELEQVTTFSPPGRSATRWNYRHDGLVDMMTLPAGADGLSLTTYGYDKDGLVTEVKQADGNGITVKRDGAGRIRNVETHPGSWHAEYDPKTGLATQLEGTGETVTLAHDGSQPISETWSGMVNAKITRQFDGQGRVVTEDIADLSKVEYRYDKAGRLIQAGELTITRNPSTGQIQSERLGTLDRTWHYNKFGEIVGTVIAAAGKPVYKLTVGRDKLGRVTERIEQLPNGKTHKRIFSYDKEDRLASVQDNHGPITKYTYDANGNLVRESSPGKTIEAIYDGQDKLVRRGTDRYEYDPAGQLATSTSASGKTTYEYDRAGHLVAVTLPSGRKVAYAVDGFGRRIGRAIDGKLTHAYAYADTLRPAAELNGESKVISRFVYTLPWSAPTYFSRDGKTFLIITDELGTPRLIVDAATGKVIEEIENDPWGRITSGRAQGTIPFGLAGGLADPDTGLVHFGMRDYDPRSGRWTAQDPLGINAGDANLYRYASGDPINQTDPTGAIPYSPFPIAGGGWHGQPYGPFSPHWDVNGPRPYRPDVGGPPPESPADSRKVIARRGRYGWPGPLPSDDAKPYDPAGDTDRIEDDPLGNAIIGAAGGVANGAVELGTGEGLKHVGKHFLADELAENILHPLYHVGERAVRKFLSLLGDPHIQTADGLSFAFMAVGEFTALRSDSEDMVVQVRLAPWKDSRWVSVTHAVALSVNGDRIMIEHSHESLLLRINSKSTDLKGRIDLPKGGFLVPEGHSYLIAWPDGSVLRVLRNVRGLDLSMGLAEGRKGTVSGLLGPFTGTQADAIVTKAGTSIKSDEINYKRLYHEYGDSWRITQAESLFDYEPGKSTQTYDDRTFPDPNPPKIPAATENSARAICERAGVPKEALAGCILDVSVTGEAGFAMTTAAAMRPLASPLPVERTAPATKDQPNAQTFPLKLGDHVAVDKPAKGAGRIEMAGAVDQYTFTAQAGTVVYFKSEPPCTNKDLHWSVRNASGNYESRAGLENICEDIGRIQLKDGGTYTITVAGRKDTMATGDYGFAVLPVAADQTFPLKLGDHVAVDKPAKGAGRIEMAGAVDQYTFTAQAGTVVYFRSEPPCTNKDLYWSVRNAAGDYVSRFGDLNSICGDIGQTPLKDGGTYTITVFGRDGAIGDYGFTLQYDRK